MQNQQIPYNYLHTPVVKSELLYSNATSGWSQNDDAIGGNNADASWNDNSNIGGGQFEQGGIDTSPITGDVGSHHEYGSDSSSFGGNQFQNQQNEGVWNQGGLGQQQQGFAGNQQQQDWHPAVINKRLGTTSYAPTQPALQPAYGPTGGVVGTTRPSNASIKMQQMKMTMNQKFAQFKANWQQKRALRAQQKQAQAAQQEQIRQQQLLQQQDQGVNQASYANYPGSQYAVPMASPHAIASTTYVTTDKRGKPHYTTVVPESALAESGLQNFQTGAVGQQQNLGATSNQWGGQQAQQQQTFGNLQSPTLSQPSGSIPATNSFSPKPSAFGQSGYSQNLADKQAYIPSNTASPAYSSSV